jgi:hypothetical protein
MVLTLAGCQSLNFRGIYIRTLKPIPSLKNIQSCVLAMLALKCQDITFQLWLSALPIGREYEDAAQAVRAYCEVNSRADILPGTHAGDRWIVLLRAYEDRNGARG